MLGPLLCGAVMLERWSLSEAQRWGEKQKWAVGCNYIPSTAINQLEMWQGDTFDIATIDREFALMQRTGMSLARIYLHDLAYEADPVGFKGRMQQVVVAAKSHKIRIIFVFFDDCWRAESSLGQQPKPISGVHNSGWLRSPAHGRRQWPNDLARLKTYVIDVLRSFSKDRTVWMWDLYNEPGNSGYGSASLPLLKEVFGWAREVRPSQPLTAAAFAGGSDEVDRACLELSDVITFHCYDTVKVLKEQIAFYKRSGRPVVCTEWMARTNDSRIATHLPEFRAENVSCVQWGFVSGKTNTIYPWGSPEGAPEPEIWFHDLFRKDGTPFDPSEISLYQKLTGTRKPKTSQVAQLPVVPNAQGVPGLRLIADMPLRDPSICRGPDGEWYMTGTVPPFWDYNEGIQVWRSKDFKNWQPLGFVWKYGQSPWHKPYLEHRKPLWAPEIHYAKGTFWLTYSIPSYEGFNEFSACGLLRSTSGKAEGPYVDVNSKVRLGNEIDASLFEDTDGSVYYLWHCGNIAKMKPDLSGFAEEPRRLKLSVSDPDPKHHSGLCSRIFGPNSFDHIGYEGVNMIKRNGIYYLLAAEEIEGRYSTVVATSRSIDGPFSARYELIPHGGHTSLFQDERGEWWATYFGSDGGAPWQEKPGVVPLRFTPDGRLTMDFR